MNVSYWISSGTPCAIPSGFSGVTIAEALEDFRAYIHDCKRFGNEYAKAVLEKLQ